jgi:urease accessory protein
MYAHLEPQVSGWWSGVLHPMEAPDHLVTMLLVGLLGGLAVRAGRSSSTLPSLFMIGLLGCGLIGVGIDRGFENSSVLYALAALLGVLVFVNPRFTGIIAPVAVLGSGALHGLSHSADASQADHPLGYVAGFVFTSGLLLTVGAIVGAAIGHAMKARRPVEIAAQAAPRNDRALV